MAGALLVAAALLLMPGQHRGAAVSPQCHAASPTVLPMAQAASHLAWTCAATDWPDGQPVTWLHFDTWDREHPPTLFVSRITMFQSIAVAAVAADGSVRVRNYRHAEARPLLAGPVFGVELPTARPDTRAYLVRIVRPHSLTIASEASLRAVPLAGVSPVSLVLLAMVAGMLIMPLLFDIMYFVVLGERFALLHVGMLLSMMVYIMSAGGVVTAFVVLPVTLLAVAGPLAFALGTVFAGYFITAFVEQGILPTFVRRLTNGAALMAAGIAGFCALQLPATQSFDNQLYFLAMAPIPLVYLTAIGVALWRGSRAARFLVCAFVPIFATGCERMLRGLGYYAGFGSIDTAMFFALALEVIIATLGVADRFLSIRRERDQAIVNARTHKLLAERDSLTGLLNRRVIEERFALLRQEGFTALAVVDLDFFKRVNDTYGHATGDRVLQVVGRALRSGDEDLMAFRMGGEEFLLLLRGSNAVQRADNRRQEIARAIAQEDLGCLVTASMGIVEVTGGALPGASFATIYSRADRLLYQAKAAGRNRMVFERIKAFQPRRRERRAAA